MYHPPPAYLSLFKLLKSRDGWKRYLCVVYIYIYFNHAQFPLILLSQIVNSSTIMCKESFTIMLWAMTWHKTSLNIREAGLRKRKVCFPKISGLIFTNTAYQSAVKHSAQALTGMPITLERKLLEKPSSNIEANSSLCWYLVLFSGIWCSFIA